MIRIERDFYAYLDELNTITILIPYSFCTDNASFTLVMDQHTQALNIVENYKLDQFMKYVCRVEDDIQLGNQYWIVDAKERRTDLQMGAVIRTLKFDERFFYQGELGVKYTNEESLFKLWAPTATGVKLKLWLSDEKDAEKLDLARGKEGVWSISVKRDVEHYKYTYLVCVNLQWKEAVDPYAVSVTANGKEGVVIDLAKTKIPDRKLSPLASPVDAIIYETHIRDFTSHPNSGVKQKGTYLGAAELGTKGEDGLSTCLSYVKELGVTHIEFLPFHDFEGVDELGEKSEYNWGYNPVHFNVPDGSYCSNPNDPYNRIVELKQLIASLHENDLRVIIDVVYNHVYIREESHFEKIVPGYYFRHDAHGMPSDGTGVGNDIASERLMVRKFIKDSVLFWLQEYGVDVFRFDLMGILDTDTMNEIRTEINNLDPAILMIGEGWDLNTPLPPEKKASIKNQASMEGVAHFNDWFRDTIKGSTFNLYDSGYALGNSHYYQAAWQVLSGSIGIQHHYEALFTEPNKTVNYVESHDNHTLWDKISMCKAQEDELVKQKYHRLATVMVLLAQGIPFLQSGQEFFRTKKGVGNSYQSPDEINSLDWGRRCTYHDSVDYIKGIITLRKSHGAFRLATTELIKKHLSFLSVNKPIIGLKLTNVKQYGCWNDILIYFNPEKTDELISLPEGQWNIIVNGQASGVETLETITDKKLIVKALSCFVLVRP